MYLLGIHNNIEDDLIISGINYNILRRRLVFSKFITRRNGNLAFTVANFNSHSTAFSLVGKPVTFNLCAIIFENYGDGGLILGSPLGIERIALVHCNVCVRLIRTARSICLRIPTSKIITWPRHLTRFCNLQFPSLGGRLTIRLLGFVTAIGIIVEVHSTCISDHAINVPSRVVTLVLDNIPLNILRIRVPILIICVLLIDQIIEWLLQCASHSIHTRHSMSGAEIIEQIVHILCRNQIIIARILEGGFRRNDTVTTDCNRDFSAYPSAVLRPYCVQGNITGHFIKIATGIDRSLDGVISDSISILFCRPSQEFISFTRKPVTSRQCNDIPSHCKLGIRYRTTAFIEIVANPDLLLYRNGNRCSLAAGAGRNNSRTALDTSHSSGLAAALNTSHRRAVRRPCHIIPIFGIGYCRQGNGLAGFHIRIALDTDTAHRSGYCEGERLLRLPIIPPEALICLEVNCMYSLGNVSGKRIFKVDFCISTSTRSNRIAAFAVKKPSILFPSISTISGNLNLLPRIILSRKICQRYCLIAAIGVHRRHDKGAEGADREGGVAGGGVEHAVFALTIGDVQRVDQFAVFRLQRHTGQSHGGRLAFRQGIGAAVLVHQADVIRFQMGDSRGVQGFHQRLQVIFVDAIAHRRHLNRNAGGQGSLDGRLGRACFGGQRLLRGLHFGSLIVDVGHVFGVGSQHQFGGLIFTQGIPFHFRGLDGHSLADRSLTGHGIGNSLFRFLIQEVDGIRDHRRGLFFHDSLIIDGGHVFGVGSQHQFGRLIGAQSIALDFGGFDGDAFTNLGFTGGFRGNGLFGGLVQIPHGIAHHSRSLGNGCRSLGGSGGFRSRSRVGGRSLLRSRGFRSGRSFLCRRGLLCRRGFLHSRSLLGCRFGRRLALRFCRRSRLLVAYRSLLDHRLRILCRSLGRRSSLTLARSFGRRFLCLRFLLFAAFGCRFRSLLGFRRDRLFYCCRLGRFGNGRCFAVFRKDLDRSQGSQHRKDQQYADHAACLEP